MAEPRSRAQRRQDTEHLLTHDVDPRALQTPYRWFRISPRRLQAWREVDELPERQLMRDGQWLA